MHLLRGNHIRENSSIMNDCRSGFIAGRFDGENVDRHDCGTLFANLRANFGLPEMPYPQRF
jgi:hypothetical protein